MGDGFDWRWLFRRRCQAIAACESTSEGVRITLCRRWRWHGGGCSA